jgi:hypothetical protein
VSKRRLPKPKWHRYVGIAVAVVVVGGGAALAAGAVGGGGGDGSPDTVAAARSGDGDGAPADGASPAASGSAKPSASSSTGPSASASATASGKPSASASGKATSPASGKKSGSASGSGSGSSGASKPSTVSGPAHPASADVFTGLAFDTCTAPSSSRMSAWKESSPYGGVAVYIGGSNRGCSQPNLTSSWVRTVSADGWKLIPIYVGAQPPCQSGGNSERIGATNAASLGASDGADAVADAQSLGMRAGSALYLDMEGFDSSDTACVDSVLTYVQAWDKALHARGYWAGFYGFSSSSAKVVDDAKSSTPDMPDALWYARYDGSSTATGFSGKWPSHRSGHQYKVNSKETYGGATITVDRDAWDAPVAVIG